jgi:hypothetical protein
VDDRRTPLNGLDMAIFLSYSRKDEEIVKVLAQGFDAAHKEVSFDHDLSGGDIWWDKILDNIRSASVFVFALSDESLHSKPCRAELDYARALDRLVLAVQVGPVTNFRSSPVADLQTIRFHPDNAISAFEIMAAIDEASDQVRPLPDPLPTPPPIPYAYLLALGRQIDSTELDQAQQTTVVDQLHRAITEETDEGVCQDMLAMLRDLMNKPWATRRTVIEAEIIIRTATVTPDEEESIGEQPRSRGLGRFRRNEERRAPDKTRADEEQNIPAVDQNVQFTVYRPPLITPGIWYSMLAFAHLAERRPDARPDEPDPLDRVRELAAQSLGDQASAYEGPRAESRGAVPRESELTFVPYAKDIDFNPPSQTFEWQEDVHQQNFRLRAKSGAPGRVVGRMTVYLGAFILADVDLVFRIDQAAAAPPYPRPVAATLVDTTLGTVGSTRLPNDRLVPVTGRGYRKVFPSYSHKDLAIVKQAEAYGAALGDIYLRDRTTLHSGEDWNERLLTLIEEADVFQLFWSWNSMASDYVRREWEHALHLARNRESFIRPTYWQVPMPTSVNPKLPPDDLRRLHFHAFNEWPTPTISAFEPNASPFVLPPPPPELPGLRPAPSDSDEPAAWYADQPAARSAGNALRARRYVAVLIGLAVAIALVVIMLIIN